MDSMRGHITRTTVVMADTDAAGVVYFSRVFDIAHRCYEEMMAERGLPLQEVLATGRYALPIVAAGAEIGSPIRLGDRLDVELEVAEIGYRSYRLTFQLRGSATPDRVGASVTTSHVAVDISTGRAMPLPDEVVAALRDTSGS